MNLTELRNASLDDFAREIASVWVRDQARPMLMQWLGVVDHASRLMEELRKTAWHGVAHELAEVFVWWLAFANRTRVRRDADSHLALLDRVLWLNVPPSQIVWSKFPGVCPVCFGFALADIRDLSTSQDDAWQTPPQEITELEFRTVLDMFARDRQCKCLSRKALVEDRCDNFKAYTKQQLGRMLSMGLSPAPPSLAELERILTGIYKPAIDLLRPEEVAFHLLEEIGEVSQAMFRLYLQPFVLGQEHAFVAERRRRLRALQEELADVFSWIVTMRAKAFSVLDCSSKYARRVMSASAMDIATVGIVEAAVGSVSSLVDLTCKIYGSVGDELRCEVCKVRPCDARAPGHKEDWGDLYGHEARRAKEFLVSL